MKKILISMIVSVGLLFAGNPTKVGTSSGLLLTMSADPQGMALAGAHYGSVMGLNSVFYNPAGLSSIDNFSAYASQMDYLLDLQLSQVAFGLKVSDNVAIAVHGKFLDLGDIEVTTLDASNGTGEILNPSYSSIGVTYSQKFTDRINFGATINYYSEDVLKVQGSAVSVDLGIQYQTDQGLNLGLALRNVGTQVTYTGNALSTRANDADRTPYTIDYESFNLPTQFIITLDYRAAFNEENAVNVYGKFTNFNQGLNRYSGAVEYEFQKLLYVRGSYEIMEESESSIFDGLAFGFGLNVEMGETSMLQFGYAYKSTDFDAFDDLHSFGVTLDL